MEIYLSHMVVFRMLERIGLNVMIGSGWAQYALTVMLVLAGTIVFAVVMGKVLATAGNKSREMIRRRSG